MKKVPSHSDPWITLSGLRKLPEMFPLLIQAFLRLALSGRVQKQKGDKKKSTAVPSELWEMMSY